ncbi:MAG: hypothetical protein WDW38_001306 [Sanguina aurantia]
MLAQPEPTEAAPSRSQSPPPTSQQVDASLLEAVSHLLHSGLISVSVTSCVRLVGLPPEVGSSATVGAEVALLPPFFSCSSEEAFIATAACTASELAAYRVALLRALTQASSVSSGPVEDSLRDTVFASALPTEWLQEHDDPAGLNCKLYRYQRRALSWMVWRESLGGEDGSGKAVAGPNKEDLRWKDATPEELMWEPIPLQGGQTVYLKAETHQVSVRPAPAAADSAPVMKAKAKVPMALKQLQGEPQSQNLRADRRPIVREQAQPMQSVGILADEMGLGKTVEVAALMLARPHTLRNQPALPALVPELASSLEPSKPNPATSAEALAAPEATLATHLQDADQPQPSKPAKQQRRELAQASVGRTGAPVLAGSTPVSGSHQIPVLPGKTQDPAAGPTAAPDSYHILDPSKPAIELARSTPASGSSLAVDLTGPVRQTGRAGRLAGPNIIITPATIMLQWQNELQRHSKLSVMVREWASPSCVEASWNREPGLFKRLLVM